MSSPAPKPTPEPPPPTAVPATVPPSPQPRATPTLVSATPSPLAATPRVHPLQSLPDTPEQARAAELIAGEPGVYGFVVLDDSGAIVMSHNGTTPFITASTYKLILMA
ncbi:MAG TPA: hypothetical protein VNZ55_12330, partial [Thermomicrobiales bacterium]|nr:hypothetical protein [Thermomicrobiales bacterium]